MRIRENPGVTAIQGFDIPRNIAEQSRLFETAFFRGFLHFGFQHGNDLIGFAVQHFDQGIQPGEIFLFGNFPDTGTAAVPHGTGQTMRIFIGTRFSMAAGAQPEITGQEFHGLLQSPAVRERSVIQTGIVLAEPRQFRIREFGRHVDFQQRHAFVVPQQDIVFRCIFLDQPRFQQQGFFLAVDRDAFPGFDRIDERTQFGVGTGFPRRLEILAHPPPQVGRLADIDHGPERITVDVASGFRRNVAGVEYDFFHAHQNSSDPS